MLIQSLEQTFTVIQLLSSSDLSVSYLCRDYAQQNPSDYLLVQVKEPELVKRIVPVFMEFTREDTFKDFAGSFPKDGSVYGVFHYSSFPTWAQKRERESCGLMERLEIAKNLLDKMLLYRMPLYFQRHVLTPDRVCVAPSLEIGFRYELQDIGFCFSVTQEQVSLAFQQFFEDLFSEELELQSSQSLEEFVLDCVKADSLEDLYRRFIPLYQSLREQLGKPQTRPPQRNSKAFQIWEIVKDAVRLLRPVLAAAVILAVIIYLIATWNVGSQQADGAGTISYIGTVEIKE